jgi:hypothetical protein
MAPTPVIHPGFAGRSLAGLVDRGASRLDSACSDVPGTPMAQVPRKTKINGRMAPSRGRPPGPECPDPIQASAAFHSASPIFSAAQLESRSALIGA